MYCVAAFYHFAPLPDPRSHKATLAALACTHGVKGSILLAEEGVNGTIAGPRNGVSVVLAALRAIPGFAELDWKESDASEMPFERLKVRLKREIVTMGRPEADPNKVVGTYVEPSDWNALISSPDVVVIDTRNDYEVEIGTFRGAIDPETKSFSEFPEWWAEHEPEFSGKRIAMFCTGGIRCEKATSFVKQQGVDQVFHLKGGILKYLEDVPEAQSLWDGECYVFDRRVSLGHGLIQGPHEMCFACGRPVSPDEKNQPTYEAGVSCARCIAEYSDEDKARFRERQRQRSV